MKIYDFHGKKNISGDRIRTDYELIVLSKVLGVSLQWLVGLEE